MRPCAATLTAPGRVSYLFGDLPADAKSAAELSQADRDHAAAADGWMPRSTRAGRLQAGILARIPPLHWLAEAGDSPVAWPT